MDQDDSQDQKIMSTGNASPHNSLNTEGGESSQNGIDTYDTMTHSKPEVSIPNDGMDLRPAEINTIETTTVGPEIEPSTEAFTPNQTAEPATTVSNSIDDNAPLVGAVNVATTPAAETFPPIAVNKRERKRLILAVSIIVLLFAAIGAVSWWLVIGNNDSSATINDDALSSSTEQAKMGIALTVADGAVEYSIDGEEWLVASAETQLKEGDFVRTGTDSRAVLTLDDGSAVRLDASTAVKLVNLSVNSITIEQIEGVVYSRVVPSERTYTVTIDKTTYQALGTAFVTINKENESGVQVYQSSVKTNDSDEVVEEGKQYYKINKDTMLKGKITGINLGTIINDTFIDWNLNKDESDNNFKERLGILTQLKEMKTVQAERQSAEKQKEAVEKALQAKVEEERKKREEEDFSKDRVTRGTMTLTLTNKVLSWNYTGKAIYGYKLVYSKKSPTPVYGTDDASYFSEAGITSGELPKKSEIGSGKYYVRVCAYTADSEDEKCVDYSNVVVINI